MGETVDTEPGTQRHSMDSGHECCSVYASSGPTPSPRVMLRPHGRRVLQSYHGGTEKNPQNRLVSTPWPELADADSPG